MGDGAWPSFKGSRRSTLRGRSPARNHPPKTENTVVCYFVWYKMQYADLIDLNTMSWCNIWHVLSICTLQISGHVPNVIVIHIQPQYQISDRGILENKVSHPSAAELITFWTKVGSLNILWSEHASHMVSQTAKARWWNWFRLQINRSLEEIERSKYFKAFSLMFVCLKRPCGALKLQKMSYFLQDDFYLWN